MGCAFEFSCSTEALSVDTRKPVRARRTELRATSVRDGPAVIVTVGGEIDASNADFWSRLLSKMASAATVPGPFVVDVRNLRFMACSAFPILAREAQQCRRRGFNLCLVSNLPVIARTAAACGVRPVVFIVPTVQEALSRTTAPPPSDHLRLVRQ
jgi:anti-anti-sigma factor